MIISKLEVKNFRCIKDATMNFDRLSVIVGRNGAGKSTFLSAIDIFFDINAKVTDEDYFNKDVSAPIEIRVTFINLRMEEIEDNKSFIREGQLTVTKRIEHVNSTYMA